MKNPELPMSTRLRCAEFIIDKTWPKEAQNSILGAIGGVEWLELRFTSPGGSTESHRIDLEPALPLLQGGNSTLEHEQDQTLSSDADTEYGKSTEEAQPE